MKPLRINLSQYKYILILLMQIAWGQKTSNQELKIDSLLKVGDSYLANLNNNQALKNYELAKKTAKNYNKSELEFNAGISIANLYVMTDRLDLAGDFFENNFPNKNFPPEIISRYYHRKAFYFDQGIKWDSVITNANKGLLYAKKYNLIDDQVTIYNELGYVYGKFENWKESLLNYDKALQLSKKGSEMYYSILLNKSRTISHSDNKKAISILENSLSEIKNKNWLRKELDFTTLLFELYKKEGDSLNYYKYKAYNADIFANIISNDKDKSYNDLLLKYQTNEKDEELLQRKKESRWLTILLFSLLFLFIIAALIVFLFKKKNKQLSSLLQNNNILLQELNHRVKNNLQLIVSLTARETGKADTQDITGLVNLSTKIESIASLHKQLYNHEDIKVIEIVPYLEDIVAHLSAILEHRNIKLTTTIDNFQINSDTALYIGLLINELIINSVKHAFVEGKEKSITIKITKEFKNITIAYCDNGKGLTGNNMPKLVSTLSRQLDAHFKIEGSSSFVYKAEIKI